MRRLVVLLAAVAMAAAGCADDDSGSTGDETRATTPITTAPTVTTLPSETTDSTEREQHFTRADLPRLALQPSDAPRGMRYTKGESGHKQLIEVGIALNTQVKELRSLQFRAVYDAIFDAPPKADVRLATRLWLFGQATGASRWLERTRGNSFAVALQPIPAPRLADGSWAARGNVGGSDVITHAFRSGNLVVLVTFSTQSKALSEAAALAAARKAATRARKA